jgi:hypothetical protein
VLGQKLWRSFAAGVAVAVYDRYENLAVTKGKAWAARERAIATVSRRKPISAANLAFGRAFPDSYSVKKTLPALGKVLAGASAKAGKPRGLSPLPGTGPARIRTLAFFSHGSPSWLGIGSGITRSNVKSLVKSIAPTLTTDVNIILYACGAARDPGPEDWHRGTFKSGGARSLGAKIRDALLTQGAKQATVWGHTTAGHMTHNFALRIFYAAHGKGTPGESYAGEFPLDFVEELMAFFDLEKEIRDRGYLVPSSKRKRKRFNREAYRRLSGSTKSLFYKCYAKASKTLKIRGVRLDEMAPTDPLGVAKVIEDYWKNVFWPRHKPKLATAMIKRFRLRKATTKP